MDNSFRRALQDAGYSVTGPRLAVLEVLHQSGEPLAPAELAARLNGQLDRSTVYRTIGLLRQLAFIQDVPSGWRTLVELGDRFDPHHHHITCQRCGQVATLEDGRIETQLDEMARLAGFNLAGHQLELTGICSSCQSA